MKIIKKETLWDGKNESDSLWNFLEKYVSDWNCNYVAWIDDIDKIQNKDYDEDFVSNERNKELFNMTEEELTSEKRRMISWLVDDAYDNYLKRVTE